MKTNEVKACVIRQLRRLQVLPEPQRRAELAELRRGAPYPSIFFSDHHTH